MRLANQILTYGAANVFNAAIPFLLLPLLTTYLAPADYGVLALLQLYAALALPFIGLNIQGLISVDFFRLGKPGIALVNGSAFWLSALIAAILTLAMLPFSGPLADLFSAPAKWLLLIPLFCLAQVVPSQVTAVYQAEQQVRRYCYFKLALTVINVALSIWLVVRLDKGWEGRIGAVFLANALFTSIGWWLLIREGAFRNSIRLAQIRNALRFGVPLIPHVVCGVLLAMSDRIILTHFAGLDQTGKYTVAYQLASVLSLLFASVNQALAPNIFSSLTGGETGVEQRLVARSYKIMLLMLATYAAFAIAAPFAVSLFLNERYHSPAGLLALLGLGFLFQGWYFVVTNYIFFSKKTHFLSLLTGCAAVVSVGLNLFLVPRLGILGCALAMALSWLVLCLGAWSIANKLHPMPWLAGIRIRSA